MKKIGIAQFKAECPRPSADLIGSLRGKLEVHGDILSTGLSWDAGAEY
jgi:hypothetical protein